MEENRAIALHHPGPYVKKILVQAIAYYQKVMYNLKVRKNFMLQKMILYSYLAVVLKSLLYKRVCIWMLYQLAVFGDFSAIN